MNASGLLAQAPKRFDDLAEIKVYSPIKFQDIYGFQYLIKGVAKSIRGSIHKESNLEENQFGRYKTYKSIISTKEQLNLGDILEYNGITYAVSSQVNFNRVMDLKHFDLVNLIDYYAEFVVDTQDQANRILGSDCTRYILAMDFNGIPVIPSMFEPNQSKYLSLSVNSTHTRSLPYKNNELFLEQIKQDNITLYAVGLDTDELQQVAYDFSQTRDIGIGQFPSWERENKYDMALDLKANIHRLDLVVNYKITTTTKQEVDKLIKRVAWNLNFN